MDQILNSGMDNFVMFIKDKEKHVHLYLKFKTENILIWALHCKIKMYLCNILLEKWQDAKNAFFALSWNRNRQFHAKGWRQWQRSFCLYMCVQPMLYSFGIYFTAWDIVSLFIFARRLAMPDFDEWNKSHAFLMPMTFVWFNF